MFLHFVFFWGNVFEDSWFLKRKFVNSGKKTYFCVEFSFENEIEGKIYSIHNKSWV